MKKTIIQNQWYTSDAAAPLVRFPNYLRWLAKTPGLMKPVYFWMKVNPPSPPMPNKSSQVKITAMIMAATTVSRPTQTNFCSSAFWLKYFLKISNVKMVEMLFALPANEATIAAVNAAMDNPFKPVGRNPNMAEYAPSLLPPSSCGRWPFLYNQAAIQGALQSQAHSSFRNPQTEFHCVQFLDPHQARWVMYWVHPSI